MMIAVIVTKDRIRSIAVRRETILPVLQGEIAISCSNEGYRLRTYGRIDLLKNCRIAEGEMLLAGSRSSSETAAVYFCSDEGLHSFHRYSYGGRRISIGTGLDDDIQTASPYLMDRCLEIDPSARRVYVRAAIPVALNGRRIMHECSFADGDVLDCLHYRFLLHSDFISVNSVPGLSSILPTAMCETVRKLPLIRHEHPQIYHHASQMQSFRHEIQVRPYVQPTVAEPRPLLYTIGPAFTMASASLAAGGLMALETFRHSAYTSSVLSALILPAVMMISTLVWTPLSFRHEKKKTDHLIRETTEAYLNYLQDIIERIEKEREELTRQRENLYITEGNGRYTAGTDETVQLCLGRCQETMDAVVRDEQPQQLPEEIREKLRRLKECCTDSTYRPYIANDKQIRIISYTCQDRFLRLQQLFLQAVQMMIPCILLFDEEDRALFSNLLNAQCLFNQEGYRMAACTAAGIRSLYRHKGIGTYAVFSFRADGFPEAWKEEKDFRIFAGLDVSDADLIIQGNEDSYSLLIKESGKTYPLLMEQARNEPVFRYTCERYPFAPRQYHGFLDVYGVRDVQQLNIAERWHRHRHDTSLKALLGFNEQGERVYLDLSETGDGPHGLIAGTTGSGKSELMMAMILSLAVEYSPDEICFVIVDFKGGGISAVFSQGSQALPHVAGTLTNLEESETDRVLAGIRNECTHREQSFLALQENCGHQIRNLQEYRTFAKMNGFALMPELVIVVDEFAQLKSECPQFLDGLLAVARIGRSLGMHLILSTQKPAGVVSEEIRANTRFRICLRVEQPEDSREVLRSPEASQLQQAGEFILEKGGELTKGKCAYTSAITNHAGYKVLLNMQRETAVFRRSEENCKDTDLMLVLGEIHACSCGRDAVKQIWYNALKRIEQSDLPQDGRAVLGRYDDYLHTRQDWLRLSDYGPVTVVFTHSRLLRNMMRQSIEAQSAGGISYIELDGSPELCRDIAEHIHECIDTGKALMIFASSLSDLGWRNLAMIQNRICLGDLTCQEIAGILERRIKKAPADPEAGYCLMEAAVPFRMVHVPL